MGDVDFNAVSVQKEDRKSNILAHAKTGMSKTKSTFAAIASMSKTKSAFTSKGQHQLLNRSSLEGSDEGYSSKSPSNKKGKSRLKVMSIRDVLHDRQLKRLRDNN